MLKLRTWEYQGGYIWEILEIYVGEGNGNPLHCPCLENPTDNTKRQKDMTMEDEPPRLEGVQYATGKEQRAITDSSRKNEVAGSKQKLAVTLILGCVWW